MKYTTRTGPFLPPRIAGDDRGGTFASEDSRRRFPERIRGKGFRRGLAAEDPPENVGNEGNSPEKDLPESFLSRRLILPPTAPTR